MSQPLNLLLDSIVTPIIMIDEEGLILFFNQALCEYFNVTDMRTGIPLTSVISHPDLLRLIVNQHTHGEIHLAEFERYLTVELAHLGGIGTLAIMHDITHLKSLDRMKSNLVSDISRNLRSPLTAIVGYAELLGRMGDLNPQQLNFVERITMSVTAMTRLISDLMELEKVETGSDTTKQAVDMGLIVRYSIDGLHHALLDKRQTLHRNFPANMPPVEGNPIRLRQMVNNLLQNAIQYTPDHGEIAIELKQENGFIILAIVDNGIGIPPEDQPYIFDKFYRSATSISMGASSGLGLSIVKNIVEQHNGRIWMESQPNLGTTFTVMLPCAEVPH